MNKTVLIFALAIISCDKKETAKTAAVSIDSTSVFTNVKHPDSAEDKVAGVFVAEPNEPANVSNTFRVVEDGKIIKTINGDMIPLTLSDEFTKDRQQYIIKIKNFSRQNISAMVTPQDSSMNIRFNQIKLPNGDFEGPLGREMLYKTRDSGEIWLIIGKSNMASGKTTGKFKVIIK